jgi:hypothetical protein
MGVKLLHMKAVEGVSGVDIELPILQTRAGQCFDIFRSRWTLKPKRLINWRQSFARKGARYEEYVFVKSEFRAGQLRHVFQTEKKLGEKEFFVLHQSGNSDALLQGEVLTFECYSPVLPALAAGAQTLNGDYDEIVDPQGFEWITARKHLAPFERWLEADPDDHFLRKFRQFFIENWTPGSSFVQVVKIA